MAPVFPIARPRVSGIARCADDLVCFSDLRWNFVDQRPRDLLTRIAGERRVLFIEEALADTIEPRVEVRSEAQVTVVVPHLPSGLDSTSRTLLQKMLLGQLLREHQIVHPILWYSTPIALEWTRQVEAKTIVFDCMDELSAFAHAPASLFALEEEGYGELPAYVAGWDVPYLPFARNDATRFISPTKTPEYLAAGRRVVFTSIADVVRPYGERGFAIIADTPEECAAALDALHARREDAWLRRVDDYLFNLSSDRTYAAMRHVVTDGAEPTMVRRGSRGQQVPPMLQLGDSDVRLPDRRGGVRG